MTVMSITSKEAYASIAPRLGEKQKLVLEALEELGVATNKQIAQHLGWEINRVTGRMKELRDYGRIELHSTTRELGSKMRVKVWKLHKPTEQVSLFEEALDCE